LHCCAISHLRGLSQGDQVNPALLCLHDYGLGLRALEANNITISVLTLHHARILVKATDLVFQRANLCRIYLRVETVADLCNEEGTQLLKAAFDGEPSAVVETTELWPRQPRPGTKHWAAWKTLLRRLCKDRSLDLRKPLGAWTCKPTARR
jgi:hypothetical protein